MHVKLTIQVNLNIIAFKYNIDNLMDGGTC